MKKNLSVYTKSLVGIGQNSDVKQTSFMHQWTRPSWKSVPFVQKSNFLAKVNVSKLKIYRKKLKLIVLVWYHKKNASICQIYISHKFTDAENITKAWLVVKYMGQIPSA